MKGRVDINLAAADFTVILIYGIVLTALGVSAMRGQRGDTDDYLLAGRGLGTTAFVATLVATWYGGILGMGEFSYRYGIATWITQSLFFYIFAIVFALWIAPRARAEIPYTIPDRLEQYYGKPAALAGAALIFLMVSPAAYLLIAGTMVQMITGWPLWVCLVIGILLSTWYALAGGLRAVVRTDLLQAGLMFAGFGLLFYTSWNTLGNFDYLVENLPSKHFEPTGYLGVSQILVWGFIALWTFVDPGFYQRTVAARTGSVARRGILLAVCCWMVFDFMTISSGLFARAALPDIAPLQAYPLLADAILPPVGKGLFVVALLAVAMSTADSFTFLSAVTIGRDGFFRFTGRDDNVNRYTRIGWAVTVISSGIIAWLMQSVIDIWYTIGSIGLPGLIWPVVWSFTRYTQRSPFAAVAAMVGGSGTSLGWFAVGAMTGNGYPLGLDPLYPALLVATILFWWPRRTETMKAQS